MGVGVIFSNPNPFYTVPIRYLSVNELFLPNLSFLYDRDIDFTVSHSVSSGILDPAGPDDRGEKIISFSKSKVRVTLGSR